MRGVHIVRNQQVSLHEVRESETDVLVHGQGGRTVDADAALVATGRRPNSEGLGLKSLGINDSAALQVDAHMRLPNPGLYAVGDVTGISSGVEFELVSGSMRLVSDDDRSVIDPAPTFLKAIVDSRSRTLLGCLVVGDHAAVIANIASIAIRLGTSIDQLRDIPLAQPSAADALMTTLRKID
jgi:pyruvate/2-oxoglutarate dehydrogenase complex dihydrolipoamide dehydrogenase (E3) component